MFDQFFNVKRKRPWNHAKLVGQKPPLKPKEIWAIRIRLQLRGRLRDLAPFDLAIDSKLRACDLVRLRVRDVRPAGTVVSRAILLQQKDSHSSAIRDYRANANCDHRLAATPTTET